MTQKCKFGISLMIQYRTLVVLLLDEDTIIMETVLIHDHLKKELLKKKTKYIAKREV